MAEIQNYQINYTIDVKTNGIQDVTKFSEAINKLKISEKGAEAAITQVKNMVNKMDAIFKPKGRKRDVNYNVNVKTDLAEEKLDNFFNTSRIVIVHVFLQNTDYRKIISFYCSKCKQSKKHRY